jgi:hypothetical protein
MAPSGTVPKRIALWVTDFCDPRSSYANQGEHFRGPSLLVPTAWSGRQPRLTVWQLPGLMSGSSLRAENLAQHGDGQLGLK